MSEKIEPCPVCGGPAKLELGMNEYNWIECLDDKHCGITLDTDHMPENADGSIDRSPEALTRRWNVLSKRAYESLKGSH